MRDVKIIEKYERDNQTVYMLTGIIGNILILLSFKNLFLGIGIVFSMFSIMALINFRFCGILKNITRRR